MAVQTDNITEQVTEIKKISKKSKLPIMLLLDTDSNTKDILHKLSKIESFGIILLVITRNFQCTRDYNANGSIQLETELTQAEINQFRTIFEIAKDMITPQHKRVHLFPLLCFLQEYKQIDSLIANSLSQPNVDKRLLQSIALLKILDAENVVNENFLPELKGKKYDDWRKELGNTNYLLQNQKNILFLPTMDMAYMLVTDPPTKMNAIVKQKRTENFVSNYFRTNVDVLREIIDYFEKMVENYPREERGAFSCLFQIKLKLPNSIYSPFINFLREVTPRNEADSYFLKFIGYAPHIKANYAKYQFSVKSYSNAFKYIDEALQIAPNDSLVCSTQGDICRLYLKLDNTNDLTKIRQYFEKGLIAYKEAEKKLVNYNLNHRATISRLYLLLDFGKLTYNINNKSEIDKDEIRSTIKNFHNVNMKYDIDNTTKEKFDQFCFEFITFMKEILHDSNLDGILQLLSLLFVKVGSDPLRYQSYGSLSPTDIDRINKITKDVSVNYHTQMPHLYFYHYFMSTIWKIHNTDNLKNWKENITRERFNNIVKSWKQLYPKSDEADEFLEIYNLLC